MDCRIDPVLPPYQALLHFCGISALADWENFRDSIVKPGARRPRLAIKRLQAVLKLYALRRHADSRIEDQPILQLPPLEVSMDSLDLDPDELAICKAASDAVPRILS